MVKGNRLTAGPDFIMFSSEIVSDEIFVIKNLVLKVVHEQAKRHVK
jgi:hypothetical protein